MGNEMLKTIKRRRSVRSYAKRGVEDEKLQLILEAARLAPSATNVQPWHFYVVRDAEMRKKIAYFMPMMTYGLINAFIEEAPILIIGTAARQDFIHKAAALISHKDWAEMDVVIALEHMALQAAELDLGTCWIGWFNERKVKKLLKLPRGRRIVALLTLGYPKEASTPEAIGGLPAKPRKPIEDIVTFV
jgi:nitroreductase